MSIYNENLFNEIGMTEAEFDKEAKKITIDGYKLTYEEKQTVMFYIAMEWAKGTEDEMIEIVADLRKTKEELKQMDKNIKKMAKAAENYAVSEIGWNRRDFKNTYDMVEILNGNLEVALEYWEAYGEKGGEYYFKTYV